MSQMQTARNGGSRCTLRLSLLPLLLVLVVVTRRAAIEQRQHGYEQRADIEGAEVVFVGLQVKVDARAEARLVRPLREAVEIRERCVDVGVAARRVARLGRAVDGELG